MQTVTIEAEQVLTSSPEGQTASLDLSRLMQLLNPPPSDAVYPDGLKREVRQGALTLWVHQTPPRVHNLKWIAADSPTQYGVGTCYREVRIALPYVVVLAVFVADQKGRPQLSGTNECFFRNQPLRSLDDPLCYPALLNCSKFPPAKTNRPLSWICTQHLQLRKLQRMTDDSERMHRGLHELLACLFESGFNYSSEHHELSSWFSESRRVDTRVSTIENWESATREDSMFVLDVPWLPVGKSVRQVATRIYTRLASECAQVVSADDIARLVFNHGETVAGEQR